MSTPSKDVSVSSSMTIFSPRKSTVLPAERALASALNLPTGNSRLSMVAMNSAPTAPVTPAMATTGSFLTLSSMFADLQAIKKPRSFSGGASVQMMRSFDYARTAPEPPEGALVFVVHLVVESHGADLCVRFGRRQRVLGGKSTANGLNGMPLSRHKLTP